MLDTFVEPGNKKDNAIGYISSSFLLKHLCVHWVVYQGVPECVRVSQPGRRVWKRSIVTWMAAMLSKCSYYQSDGRWYVHQTKTVFKCPTYGRSCSPDKDSVYVAKGWIGEGQGRAQHKLKSTSIIHIWCVWITLYNWEMFFITLENLFWFDVMTQNCLRDFTIQIYIFKQIFSKFILVQIVYNIYM